MTDKLSLAAPFTFATNSHLRQHGPRGYIQYESFKPWLRDEFTFQCAYCGMREQWYPDGQAVFSVDHRIPLANDLSLALEYDNLYYACFRCNSLKSALTDILDPCTVAFSDHLRFCDDGSLEGLSEEGQIHIEILNLNHPDRISFRRNLTEEIAAFQDWGRNDFIARRLGFPADLPNLKRLRPPTGNTRPAGAENCYYEQRKMGLLPEIY